MTAGGMVAVAILLVLVLLVVRGIRGHRTYSDNDHDRGWHSGGESGGD